MTKTAALKKNVSVKTAAKSAKPVKKPQLKVVKSGSKKTAVAKKKPQLKVVAPKKKQAVQTKKPVKAAVKAPAKKPVAKAAAPVKKIALKAAPKAVMQKPQAASVIRVAPAMPARKPELKKPEPKKVESKKADFKVGHYVVYPTHGVGRIVAEETQSIGDISLRMLVIGFEKDKMTLRVPVHRATAAGLRHVSTNDQMTQVFGTLKSKARTSRGMWSRRAQEYEAKINSGNIHSIAEVVRDLHHNVDQAERSYSERMIYESALNRLVGELAAAEATDSKAATDKLMKLLRAKAA